MSSVLVYLPKSRKTFTVKYDIIILLDTHDETNEDSSESLVAITAIQEQTRFVYINSAGSLMINNQTILTNVPMISNIGSKDYHLRSYKKTAEGYELKYYITDIFDYSYHVTYNFSNKIIHTRTYGKYIVGTCCALWNLNSYHKLQIQETKVDRPWTSNVQYILGCSTFDGLHNGQVPSLYDDPVINWGHYLEMDANMNLAEEHNALDHYIIIDQQNRLWKLSTRYNSINDLPDTLEEITYLSGYKFYRGVFIKKIGRPLFYGFEDLTISCNGPVE